MKRTAENPQHGGDRTALVIGATGVTGRPLVRLLCESDLYRSVRVLARRDIGYQHPKLKSFCVDFEQENDWRAFMLGDDLFSAMGTTIKQAGGRSGQYQVDYHYQANCARIAAENGTKRLFLVSSPGADSHSRIFYTRIKGELEDHVLQLPFEMHCLFRPSLIQGDRSEKRQGEKIGLAVLTGVSRMVQKTGFSTLGKFVSKIRAISGDELASSMLRVAESSLPNGSHIFEYNQIQDFE